MVQAVSRRPLTSKAWEHPSPVHVGFVADEVALGQVFPCQYHSTPFLSNLTVPSYADGGQKRSGVRSESHHFLYVTHFDLKFWTAHLEGNVFVQRQAQQTESVNAFQVRPQTLCTVTHMGIQRLPLEERTTCTLFWVPLRIGSLPARKIYKCCINRVTDINMGNVMLTFLQGENSPQWLHLDSRSDKGTRHFMTVGGSCVSNGCTWNVGRILLIKKMTVYLQ